MRRSVITWNGVSSNTLGLYIETYPNIIKAQRRFEKVTVPGRNGDLFFYEDAYNNYTQTYEVGAGGTAYGNAQTSWSDLISWLMVEPTDVTIDDYINLTTHNYHQLIDTYEPDVIRLAVFTGGLDAENTWNRIGRAKIEFDVRPERFTSDAFTPITLTSSGATITNPTDRYAKPFVKVNGSFGGGCTINGRRIDFGSRALVGYAYVDCESQNVFKDLYNNLNSQVTIGSKGFPILKPGENVITWDAGITSVEITPRWWNL